MQVPRVVAKQVPYTYTVRSPRVVVTKVPVDACGNPLPAAPAAAARPASSSTPAPALSQPRPEAGSGPVRTYRDRPADGAAGEQAAEAEQGWGSSRLPHVDPQQGGAATEARRPPSGGERTGAEDIPSPIAAEKNQEPTVAPLGPAVEPAPPAHDERDLPVTGTSGRPVLRSLHSGHTT